MKIFVLSLLTAVGGYLIGVGGGILLVNLLSSNPHDKSVEAAMTGAFVTGPVAAVAPEDGVELLAHDAKA